MGYVSRLSRPTRGREAGAPPVPGEPAGPARPTTVVLTWSGAAGWRREPDPTPPPATPDDPAGPVPAG